MSRWIGPEAAPALQDFWAVYEPNAARLQQLTRKVAERHPEFGPLMRARAGQPTESSDRGTELLRRAIAGDWEAYEAHLREQGRGYAKLGISYAGWFDLMGEFQRELTERCIEAYVKEPARLSRALGVLQTFMNRLMGVLGQEFLEAKERLLLEQRLISEEYAKETAASEARYRLLFENSPI
ncbi:MAG: hypothetical protein ACJ790_03065, partial [Myxococcaceae bacterium]